MQSDVLYEEKIFQKGLTTLLTVITFIFLVLSIYLAFFESLGNQVLIVIFFAMFLLFVFVTITFNTLDIKITSEFIRVSYGIIKRQISWERVEDCYLDEASVIRYGGWGIRIGKFREKWRLVYNVVGSPRVVLLLKEGRFREFVFSTKNPDEVIELVKERINSF